VKRIESVLNNAFYLDCLGRNKEREAERAFCRHDFQHMVDVARISYILALESGDLNRFQDLYSLPDLAAAREIIYSAGLMHDLARWVQYDTGEDHAAAGACCRHRGAPLSLGEKDLARGNHEPGRRPVTPLFAVRGQGRMLQVQQPRCACGAPLLRTGVIKFAD